jgi:hypothetical protein
VGNDRNLGAGKRATSLGGTMVFWIKDGALVARPVKPGGQDYSERALLDHFHMVKIESGSEGTTVKWCMNSANWSSLLFGLTFLRVCMPPYNITYLNMGWISEQFETAEEAADRVEALIFKSDVHFSQRTYTQAFAAENVSVPDRLRKVLESGDVADDESVTCVIDLNKDSSSVERVGGKSLVGKIWGVSPVSFPCLSGNTYDRIVSRSYFDAVRTGRPVYDHVLAVMVKPDGEHHWVGYQRVIIPDLSETKLSRRHVKVTSELAPVSIQLL